jgi:serine/threonine-protein kinase
MATEIDPGYAPAHVGIARNAFFLGFYGVLPPRDAFGKMRQAAQRALDLDELLADAHAALALYNAHYERDWAEAEAGFQRALELNQNNAQVHHDYAHLLLALGRRDDSARESQKAAQLDPSNSMLTACAGWHGFTNGEYDEAVIRSLKALMMMPDMFWPEMVMGWAYEQTGQATEAIASFRKAAAHSGGTSFSMASLGHALAKANRVSEARDLLRDLEARSNHAYVSPYDIAVVHASLNDRDQALKWLEQARTERSGFLVHAGWDPRLAPLHNDARFDTFLRSLGLPKQPIARPKPAAASAKAKSM